MPDASDLSRRSFLAAFADAVTALQLQALSVVVAPAPNIEWNPLDNAGPIPDIKAFSFWKQTKISRAGNYELLRAVMSCDFHLHSMAIAYNSSCRLSTLKTYLGTYSATLSCGLKDPLLEYFRAPVSLLPFGNRTPIWPEIVIPKGSIIELRCSGDADLDDGPLLIESLFEGALVIDA